MIHSFFIHFAADIRTLTLLRQDNLKNGNKTTLLAHLRTIWAQPETLLARVQERTTKLAEVTTEVARHQAALADFDAQNPQVSKRHFGGPHHQNVSHAEMQSTDRSCHTQVATAAPEDAEGADGTDGADDDAEGGDEVGGAGMPTE